MSWGPNLGWGRSRAGGLSQSLPTLNSASLPGLPSPVSRCDWEEPGRRESCPPPQTGQLGDHPPQSSALMEQEKGRIKLLSPLCPSSFPFLCPCLSLSLSPCPSASSLLPLSPVSSLCLAASPCLSLQLPHFCGTTSPGPSQYPRALLPSDSRPLHLPPPVTPGAWATLDPENTWLGH